MFWNKKKEKIIESVKRLSAEEISIITKQNKHILEAKIQCEADYIHNEILKMAEVGYKSYRDWHTSHTSELYKYFKNLGYNVEYKQSNHELKITWK